MTEPHDNRTATIAAFAYESVVESSGRYRIVHEIGRSASGVVFKVRDNEDDSLAAAKVFAEHLQKDLAFRADLRLVAPKLAGVFHPNMVEVYRLWESANGAFLAMDYVEGESLARILEREGEFTYARGLATVIALARVLDFAAGKRLRHGSLKPSSVLVTPNRTVRLEGIGLPASSRSSEPGRQATSPLSGTNGGLSESVLPYDVAYDRVLECPGTDLQVDLYGLGLVLYHMLAGEPPVQAANPSELLFRLRRVGWPALSKTRADTPADVGRIIEKLRNRGYNGYGKLIEDLQAAAGALPADARAGVADPAQAGESCGTARLDEICAEDAGVGVERDNRSRAASAFMSVVDLLKSPRVRKPAMAAAGIIAALLLAFVLMRPIYLSKLAPPLPEEALLAPRALTPYVMPGANPLDAEPIGNRGSGPGRSDIGGGAPKDAEEAFTDATRFQASFPDQYALGIEKFQHIVSDFPGTKWASDAQVRLLEISTSRDDAMTQEFEILTKDANTLVEWEDYRGAVGRFESFLERFPQTKYRDQIRVETERIRRNAATKIALLASRAEDYITKRLPDLARLELERIVELAVDASSVVAARSRMPDVDRLAKEIAGEREEASRALAEQLKRRAFIEDGIPLISKEAALFNYEMARAALEVEVEDFPSPVPPGLDAVAKAVAAGINAEEAFVDHCFAQVNNGKREIQLGEFYGKPVKGTVKRADRTRLSFKLEGETATAAVKWSELQRDETYKFFQIFRGVNIEKSFAWGCFCFHRGNFEEAAKYFKMAQGIAGSPEAAAAAELLKLCE